MTWKHRWSSVEGLDFVRCAAAGQDKKKKDKDKDKKKKDTELWSNLQPPTHQWYG